MSDNRSATPTSDDGSPANRWSRNFRWIVAGAVAIAATVSVSNFLPAGAAAANNGLTLTPATGSTLSSGPVLSVPAPGCTTSTANSTLVTIKGTGVVGTNPDGSANVTGAVPFAAGSAISTDAPGSWDSIAQTLAIPRPLSGTFNVKIQCLEDGDATGQVFFDREVTFTKTGGDTAGSPGAWVAVGQATPTPGPGTPTPTPGTPTPTPGPGTPTPTPGPGTPTPTPGPGTPTPTPGPATPTPGPGTPTPTPGPGTPTPTPGPGTPTPTPGPGTPTPTPTGPDNTETGSVPAGGSLNTNLTVSPSDPVGTKVTSPVAGDVTITEAAVPGGTQPPAGYTLLGQQVTITAPKGSPSSPLELEFRLDSTVLGGGGIPVIFRNGAPVQMCINPAPSQTGAVPDPCFETPQNLTGGDLLLVVRTSEASLWNFGQPAKPAPIPNLDAACRAGGPVPSGWTLREGTNGDDVLIGTTGADIIRGLNGDDYMVGLGGNDLMCGGSGEDLISGGAGADLLLGGVGDDAVYGNGGDDAIGGASGSDVLNGGIGDDLIVGGNGSDLISGGPDDDLLYGEGGNDLIYGEDGFDRLYGGPGSDLLQPAGRRQ